MMPMQLELFPAPPIPPKQPTAQWKRLSQKEREALIAKLAKAMVKAIEARRNADER
jgi:hypothetical protein